MLLSTLLSAIVFAGTNNWCPDDFDNVEPNCFACSSDVCRDCMKGYFHFAKGEPCVTIETLKNGVQTSLPAENIVFLQSSTIYNKYKDIWSESSNMYSYDNGLSGNKFLLQKAISAIFTETYGDNVDFSYIASHEYLGGCEYNSETACNDRAHCNWSSNQCGAAGSMYPDQYANYWPESYAFDTMLGTVFWQPSFGSISGAFGTHFHEMGHHYLVWWDQYSQKNNWMSHQGTTGMERWGMMGGFDKSTITCDSPSGQVVTSADSCNSVGGTTYLLFPSEKGTSQFQSDDSFGTSQYSDFELLAMGMKSAEDLGSQTMMHCWADSQPTERYPASGDLEGYKVPCTEINFYTAQELKDADSNWRPAKSTFSAAHIILIPDDVSLPTDFDSMPADFQQLSNWLKEDLPNEFVKATRGTGTISYFIGTPATQSSTGTPANTTTSSSAELVLLIPLVVFSFTMF